MRPHEPAAVWREPWFRTVYQKSSKTPLPSCLPLDPASQVARLQGRTRPHATSKTPASFGFGASKLNSPPSRQDVSSCEVFQVARLLCMRPHAAAAICRERWFRTVHQTKSSKTRLPSCLVIRSLPSWLLCMRPHEAAAVCREPWFRTVYQTKSSKTRLPSSLPSDPASQVARLQGRTGVSSCEVFQVAWLLCMRPHAAAAICRERWFRIVCQTKSSKTQIPSSSAFEPAS